LRKLKRFAIYALRSLVTVGQSAAELERFLAAPVVRG
jgi:hypothetical protein